MKKTKIEKTLGPPRRQVLHAGRHVVPRLPRLRARDGRPPVRPSSGERLRARRRPPGARQRALRPRSPEGLVRGEEGQGVFQPGGRAKENQEAEVLAAGRGAEREVRVLQGRGKFLLFFFSLFSFFFFILFFTSGARRETKAKTTQEKKQSYCYDDQIKSFACYTVDSLISSLLRIGGGMSQKNIDRAAESVFAFFSFSENKKKLTSIDKLSKKLKKKLTFNRPRPSPTS